MFELTVVQASLQNKNKSHVLIDCCSNSILLLCFESSKRCHLMFVIIIHIATDHYVPLVENKFSTKMFLDTTFNLYDKTLLR